MKISLIILIQLLYGSASPYVNKIVSSDNWYENIDWLDDNPYDFNQTFMSYSNKGLHLEGHPAWGKMFAVMSNSEIIELWNNNAHSEVFAQVVVDNRNKAYFKEHFSKLGESVKVPFGVGEVCSALVPYCGYSLKALDLLNKMDASRQSSAKALSELISEGGTFTRVIGLQKDSGNHYFVSFILSYNVVVGNEKRSYYISKSSYAVKVE